MFSIIVPNLISSATMTRVSKGINSSYSTEKMLLAVDAVKSGLSIRKAAEKYGVPRSSLGDRISGRIAPDARPGKMPVIPAEVESAMVEKAMSLADQGFGVSKKQLTARAGQLCRTMGLKNRFTNGIPGKAWWSGLQHRHPTLTLRKPEKLATVRSKGMNGTVVGSYFVSLRELVTNVAPTSIWNMDETSLSLEHSPTTVVARKGSKVIPGRTSNSRETVTVLPCVNAAGQKLPPLIIVKGKTNRSLRSFNTHEGPEGALWSFQKNAWMTDEMGVAWFTEIFLNYCGDDRPQVLILDNHRSHETLGLLEAATSNNIKLFTFPPHSTHYLCPLDRTVFGPFQRSFDRISSEFMSSKASALITKMTFPKLMNQAYQLSFSRTNIVAGFESTGIYEWNPMKVPAHAFAPSIPFDKKPQEPSDEHPLQWVLKQVDSALSTPVNETGDNIQEGVNETGGNRQEGVIDPATLFVPEVVDTLGNVVGTIDVSVSNDPMMSTVAEITDEEAASILVALTDLGTPDTSLECMETSWSSVWNQELDTLFSVQDVPSDPPADILKIKKTINTSHRLLTSEEILKEKREEHLKKEKREKEKEDRKRKRESNKIMKLEKEIEKKIKKKK